MSAPLFPLGHVVATPGAMEAASGPLHFLALLARHVRGDWGCVGPEDAETNRLAVTEGDRILSAYPIDPERSFAGFGKNCLWIITKADRPVTTILLPEEY